MDDTPKPVSINRQFLVGLVCLLPLLYLLAYTLLTTAEAQRTPREIAANSRLNNPDGLWEDCTAGEPRGHERCTSFMKGYLRAYAAFTAGKEPWCLPADMTWDDLRKHFTYWLPNHPEFAKRMDSVAFQMMLREDFPCAE